MTENTGGPRKTTLVIADQNVSVLQAGSGNVLLTGEARVRITDPDGSVCLGFAGGNAYGVAPAKAVDCRAPESVDFLLSTTVRSGYYTLVSTRTGFCTDITGGSTSPGAIAIQWPCQGSDNQAFEWIDGGNGLYLIKGKSSGLCLDRGSDVVTQARCTGFDTQLFRLHETLSFTNAAPTVIASVNTAAGGLDIAQNTWIEIYGTNLAPDGLPVGGLTWSGAPEFAAGRMPTQLNGVSVTVSGKTAFVYYISKTQLNVLTPLDNATGAVQIVVTNGANTSPPFAANMRAYAPSFPLFSGTNYIVATHANGALLGPTALYPGLSTPAQPGETIVLYAFGFGLPTSPLVNGAANQAGVLPAQPVIQIGGVQAELTFAGLIGPGLYQFNVVLPATAADGDNPVIAVYSGSTTPLGDMINVQQR